MVFNTFKYILIKEVRDKVFMFLMVIFPILLSLIVGTALKSDFELPSLERADIALIDLDKGVYSEVIMDIFNTPSIKQLVNLRTDLTEIENAEHEFQNANIDGYIIIENNYSKKILEKNGNSYNIRLIDSGKNQKSMEVVKQIINEFNEKQYIMSFDLIDQAKIDEINSVYSQEYFINRGMDGIHKPGSMDYYGVTFIVMICMFGSLYMVKVLSETVHGSYGQRMKTITNKEYKIYLGAGLASLLLVAIQISILILFFKYVYKVYLGTDFLSLFLLIASFLIFIIFMGTAIITVFKNYSVAYTVSNVIILGSTFLSSGFVILNLGNGLLGNIVEKYLPNAVCQNAIFSIIYKTNAVSLQQALGVIYVWTLALIAITLIFKRVGVSSE